MKRTLLLIAIGLLAGGIRQTTVLAQTGHAPAVVRGSVDLSGGVWPGDFNGDGITDLAGGRLLAIGNGDGTFRTPTDIGHAGAVAAVGDFNRDGKLDVVMIEGSPGFDVTIVLGNGDSTFGSSWRVTDHAAFVLGADLDGDGYRDLVLGSQDTLRVIPNRGTGTFDEVITLPAGLYPHDGVIADVNGDGRRDILIANHYTDRVSVFLNHGAFNFTEVDAIVGAQANDVTTGDFNGDGKLDLAVASAFGGDFDWYFDEGHVFVAFGNGDGTFDEATAYEIPRGGWQVAVGDFTRDGILDIATANRSAFYTGNAVCISAPFNMWDSISILPGNGDGTFAAASSFTIGVGEAFQNTVVTLNTSDLNGDRATDLIASHGVLMLNRAAASNAPPVAFAGDDFTVENTSEVHLFGGGDDPDADMLSFTWTDDSGQVLSGLPEVCTNGSSFGQHTFTLTVDDGHGHRAADGVTVDFISTIPPDVGVMAPALGEVVVMGRPYTLRWGATVEAHPIVRFDVFFSPDNNLQWSAIAECTGLPAAARQCEWANPGPRTEFAHILVRVTDTQGRSSESSTAAFSLRPTAGGAPPREWSHIDVGAVAAPGSESFDNGVFTVTGSGADIWGTADEFHFVYQLLIGAHVEMTTRVDSVQNVQPWTKAGIMFRRSLGGDAAHASIFVTPGKGIAFQRRLDTGAVSVHTTGPAITAPVWLRLTSAGGVACGYYRKNQTDAWTLVACDRITGIDPGGYLGLAVTSHADGTLATAKFSNTSAGLPPTLGVTAINTNVGSTTADGTNWMVAGGGADIWGTADGLMYAHMEITGDATITARVRSIQNVHAWSKAGVMFRETLSPGAKQVDMIVSAAKGAAMQFRSATDGDSANVAIVPGAAPGWVRLTRAGHVFTGAWSKDGVTWTTLGSTTISMASTVAVGLAVTSHNPSTPAKAFFDDVAITR